MQRRRAVHAAGIGVGVALALTGCGTGPQDAGEAWRQARQQLDDAQTVRASTVTTDGPQGPHVITWDLSGPLEGAGGEADARMQVGEDSWMRVQTRAVDGTSYARVSTQGQDVPPEIGQAYELDTWQKTDADAGANQLADLLGSIGLPAADALADADVQPEDVETADGTAHRYAVPDDVARQARGDRDYAVSAFTVDDDGDLVGLRVEDDASVQELTLSDWNEIEPADVPEEVAQ